MADSAYNGLSDIGTPASDDVMGINDTSATNQTKKVTTENLLKVAKKIPHYIPCQFVVPEGTVAYPDIHDLATASAKASGAVFPDGASVSTYNIKPMLPLPSDLHATPNLNFVVGFISHGSEASNVNTRFTASSSWRADTEDLDVAFTAEAEETVVMETTLETIAEHTFALDGPTITAGDYGLIKLARDPTDAADVHTQDVQAVWAYLTCDRSVSG